MAGSKKYLNLSILGWVLTDPNINLLVFRIKISFWIVSWNQTATLKLKIFFIVHKMVSRRNVKLLGTIITCAKDLRYFGIKLFRMMTLGESFGVHAKELKVSLTPLIWWLCLHNKNIPFRFSTPPLHCSIFPSYCLALHNRYLINWFLNYYISNIIRNRDELFNFHFTEYILKSSKLLNTVQAWIEEILMFLLCL